MPSNAITKSGRFQAGSHPRDLAILADIARYRIIDLRSGSLRYGGKTGIGLHLKRLADAEPALLSAHFRALPGGITYYSCTSAGCAVVGAPDRAAAPLQGINLDACLGLRWWCHLGGRHGRFRMDHRDLARVFADVDTRNRPKNNVPHVGTISDVDDGNGIVHPAVLRVLFPRHSATVGEVAKSISRRLEELRGGPLAAWGKSRDYGLLVLVEREELAKRIRTAVGRRFEGAIEPILVDTAPRAVTYARFLKRGVPQ